ncbi:Glycosyltransferase family 20 [uncultured delta proteobacterium]|uniref:Glycosyltransferase family 20 n=1 Tax=uncultured delta proteobacterium TaxID=34034 RepID=A0A212JZL4_9DELT|nr:Glycosyltransferase family 20 [uncultured delta proteobacterium]
MKCIIISNRLPVTVVDRGAKLGITRSGGGLATGLDSLDLDAEKHWIGWPGIYINDPAKRRKMEAMLEKRGLHSVMLTPEDIQDYYEGYSNSTLWPLCHYFPSYIDYDQRYWRAYREVNEMFRDEALRIIEPGDMVWIHDYHLMLLPAMIRERMPDVSIGYFHHIPFPSYELFRCLPERADILHGLLGADLIGFHVHSYMRHFLSALYRVLGLETRMDEVRLDNRVVSVEAFPMGIHYDLYHDAVTKPEVHAHASRMRKLTGNCKTILSVDRLDYSKGIPLRLRGYAGFLENNPEFHGKVSLVLVVVPSRDTVERYAELKTAIDTLVGYINGKFAKPGWTPIFYYYRSFSFAHLSALYNAADIALVTPLRDGMNLVAKEFVAAKRDSPGVLILSEMAGAAVELKEALIVNPTDVLEIEDALYDALSMPEDEQMRRLRAMQKTVARHPVDRWAWEFWYDLAQSRKRNQLLGHKALEGKNLHDVVGAYAAAQKRLLILDYDGTLVPFVNDPQNAGPSSEVLYLLATLAGDARNTVVVSSGRERETLEQWIGHLDIGITAEHGAFSRENGEWTGIGDDAPTPWDVELLAILERTTQKTPRSSIEIKKTALVWHFREVDSWLADLRVTQLINALITPAARLGLQLMRGNKILEIKLPEYNKGAVASRLFSRDAYDFVLAMGDDTTDEDMFIALPPEAVTVKVGAISDNARYNLPSQPDVLLFLQKLALRTLEQGQPADEHQKRYFTLFSQIPLDDEAQNI